MIVLPIEYLGITNWYNVRIDTDEGIKKYFNLFKHLWKPLPRNSPALPLGKHDVVGMVDWIAFDELDARIVLPVAHRLFKQRLMQSTEVAIDLVRNDAKIPDAFFFGRCRPSWTMMVGRYRGRTSGMKTKLKNWYNQTWVQSCEFEISSNPTTYTVKHISSWKRCHCSLNINNGKYNLLSNRHQTSVNNHVRITASNPMSAAYRPEVGNGVQKAINLKS